MNVPASPKTEKSAFDDPDTLAVVQSMIQMAYQAAVDPDRFDELIETWDAFLAKAATSSNFLLLADHFEQAARIAVDPRVDRSKDLTAILDLMTAPAILVDETGAYITGNASGQDVVGAHEKGKNLDACFSGEWRPTNETDTVHFQYQAPGKNPLLAACRRIPIPQAGGAHFIIQLEASRWTDQLSETLRNTYGLTEAETDVARLMQLGKSAVEIASDRSRSLETVRTQIKSVLAKTDTRKQAGLLQFLAHLQYVVGTDTEPEILAPPLVIDRAGFERRQITMPCGRKLVSSWYGNPVGQTVIYCTTSSRPEETAAWRKALHDASLRVIALHRPGFDGSDAVGSWDQNADYMAEACEALLGSDFSAPVLLAGHREGGILAADMAQRLFDRYSIAGVVLISTGAPEVDWASFHDASDPMKRSLTAAHTVPAALRLGYRAAKRIFQSGSIGERQIVSYFFKDSPLDKALVRDAALWQIIRDNIAYCFENPDIIVEDIGRWTSNWASAFRPTSTPWHFLHGADHDFMRADRVRTFCSAETKCFDHIIPNAAQMMLYVQTDLIVSRMKAAFDT